ncbi:hypothetical protein L3Q82_018419, partial [Scortum barcoo]
TRRVTPTRQVQMILNKKDEELSLVFNLRVDDFEYVVFVTSGTLKCFGCGREGHLVRACPEKFSSVRKAQSEETRSQTEQDAEETTETQKSQENTETEREAAVSQKEDGRKNDSKAGEQTAALDTAEKTVKDTDRLNTEGHLMGGKDLFKTSSLRGNSRPSAVSLRLRKEQLIRAEAGSRSRTSQNLSPAWRRRTRRRRRKAHDEDSQSQTDSQPSVKTQQGQSYEDIKSMRDLETEIVELQRSAESTGTRGCLEDLKFKKAVLADLMGSKAQGALVRSRFQNTDGPTAEFLLWPGEEERQSRFIHALCSDKGQLLTEAGEIRRRAVQFYVQLYQSEYTEDEGAFNSSCSRLPRISEETNKELEGPLTSEEVFAVLQSMKGGKASGIDRWTTPRVLPSFLF